jgi:hypothetical protein
MSAGKAERPIRKERSVFKMLLVDPFLINQSIRRRTHPRGYAKCRQCPCYYCGAEKEDIGDETNRKTSSYRKIGWGIGWQEVEPDGGRLRRDTELPFKNAGFPYDGNQADDPLRPHAPKGVNQKIAPLRVHAADEMMVVRGASLHCSLTSEYEVSSKKLPSSHYKKERMTFYEEEKSILPVSGFNQKTA